jgi:hypothetical protein
MFNQELRKSGKEEEPIRGLAQTSDRRELVGLPAGSPARGERRGSARVQRSKGAKKRKGVKS